MRSCPRPEPMNGYIVKDLFIWDAVSPRPTYFALPLERATSLGFLWAVAVEQEHIIVAAGTRTGVYINPKRCPPSLGGADGMFLLLTLALVAAKAMVPEMVKAPRPVRGPDLPDWTDAFDVPFDILDVLLF